MFYAKSTGGFYDKAIHGDNIPADAVEITVEEHRALMDAQSAGKHIVAGVDGKPMAVDRDPPTSSEIITSFTGAIQARLDAFAQERGYDGILSASTYAASKVPKFKAEGQAAVNLRDATWAAAYQILADVEAGTRPMPSVDEIMAELPATVW